MSWSLFCGAFQPLTAQEVRMTGLKAATLR